jgi:ABC-type molybdate transport system substrate-binding protein
LEREDEMRGIRTAIFGAIAFLLSASVADAADLRVLSVGSVQIAAKALAADFSKSTGNQLMLTIVAPSEIAGKLAAQTYDMVICSVPAMAALDQAGSLRPGSRSPLARVGSSMAIRRRPIKAAW